ncbi:unnamed protein product, partial [Polarella glacialis]
MGSQHVANVLWAFAVVSYQPEIVEPLTIRAEQLVFEFRPMELAAVIWASAGAGWSSDSAFLRSASLAATSAVSAFRLDELAGVAWALARLHMDGSVFSSACLERCRAPGVWQSLTSPELVACLWALAMA